MKCPEYSKLYISDAHPLRPVKFRNNKSATMAHRRGFVQKI